MLNQVVLVGRLVRDIELKEGENGGKYATISLAIPRSYKNSEGVYETDFIDCKAFSFVAENTSEYCKKGDLLGVKGRIQNKYVEHLQQSLEVYEDYRKDIEERKATKDDKEFYNNLLNKIEETKKEIEKNRSNVEIIAEKVTFLSSRKEND